MKDNNKICVLGTGYVGLVSGVCFAEMGNLVTCIDRHKDKVEMMRKGKSPIFEPGLSELMKKNIKKERLFFETSLKKGMKGATMVFICVGTPPKKNGEADLSHVKKAAQQIAKNLQKYTQIVIKSTVPVGTSAMTERLIRRHCKAEFDVLFCPEFLREGSAVGDFLKPDRVVIGATDKKIARDLVQVFKELKAPIFVTNRSSSELIKYASNCFLANKISLINEIANVCEYTEADVEEVAHGVGLDKRIGPHFLKAGIGYGGSCFPKDVHALNQYAGAKGYDFKLLKAVIKVNQQQRDNFVKKIEKRLGNLKDKRIAVLGLAFKGNTDDIRESAAIEIIKALTKKGAKIQTYDPEAINRAKEVLDGQVRYFRNPYSAIRNCDLLAITTEWPEFKKLSWRKIKTLLKNPIILDGKNMLDGVKLRKMGFDYQGVGTSNGTK
ncbi:MAG: UDP-glucose/GDP-mannose dehydrogenase family protein [Patescibacteria group bacterium]